MKGNKRKTTANDSMTAIVCLILTFTIWGSLYVVSKYALNQLPTFTVSGLRFVIAFITLTFISRGTAQKETPAASQKPRTVERKDWIYLFLIGVGGYFIAVGAQMLGTKYAGASMASLLNSVNPVAMTFFASIFLKERLTFNKIGGILLALAGVYIILGGADVTGNMTGIIYSAFAVLLWSVVSVLMRRVTQKYDSLSITRYGIGIAAICYLPCTMYELVTLENIRVTSSCVLAVLYMGIVCTGVSYLLWNKSLSILEAGTCSAFYPIQPLVSAFLGILLLGEQQGVSFWIGTVLIIGGILFNLVNPSAFRRAKTSTAYRKGDIA